MNAEIQNIAALAVVAVATAWLIRRWFVKRKNPGCGGDCAAVSPDVKRLRARLKG